MSFTGYRATSQQATGTLGSFALSFATVAAVIGLIPCLGVLAIPLAFFTLILSFAAYLSANASGQSTRQPGLAAALSGLAIVFAVGWIVIIGAVANSDSRARAHPQPTAAARPIAPTPPARPTVPPAPQQVLKAAPQPPKPTPALEEVSEKNLLKELEKDRIQEAIRFGPGVPATAEQVQTDYLTNVVAADAKYANKVLALSGAVVRVARDDAKGTIVLEIDTGEPGQIIACEFSERTKHPLASVKKDQTVTVRGLCDGRKADTVRLKDCVFVK